VRARAWRPASPPRPTCLGRYRIGRL
jgi:hypothetical protein